MQPVSESRLVQHHVKHSDDLNTVCCYYYQQHPKIHDYRNARRLKLQDRFK
jgi:hypothetical protein